jgi:putative inorganic carbon (hco3(-)) transporter
MMRLLRSNWILFACILFVLANGLLMADEFYWLNLLPAVLLITWALFTAADSVLLFVVFATPLSINMEQLELGGIGIALPTEPLMVALMFLFLLKLGVEKNALDRRIWRHPITVVVFMQLIWMAVCIIPSSDPVISVKYLTARLWFVCTMYFMATRVFEKEGNMHRFFWLFCASLAGVILYTIIRHAGLHFEQDPAHWVMEPFFKDHTSYGATLAFMFPFAVAAISMPGYSFTWRSLGVLLLLILSAGLVLSYTRAAWVGIVGALGVFLLMRFRIPAWVVGVGAVFLGGIYLANQDQITIALERNRDESSDDLAKHLSSASNISTDASNLERINRWHSALRMFEERPVWGWGPGTYMFEYAPFQASEDRTIISTNFATGGNAHSEYLGPLAEQGLIGMLLVVVFVGTSCWTAIRLWSRMPPGRDRYLVGAAFFGLITYYVHGILNNFLDLDKASVPFWCMTAMIVIFDLKYPAKKSAEELS